MKVELLVDAPEFWARLEDGEQAHHHLQELLRHSTLPNLWDLHPPFQIDGNFGAAAGIAEMLLQSHADEIVLLPAWPSAWPNGHFTGLRARGGLTIDLIWQNGRCQTATLHAAVTGQYRLRCGTGQTVQAVSCDGESVPFSQDDDGRTQIVARAGAGYAVQFGS